MQKTAEKIQFSNCIYKASHCIVVWLESNHAVANESPHLVILLLSCPKTKLYLCILVVEMHYKTVDRFKSLNCYLNLNLNFVINIVSMRYTYTCMRYTMRWVWGGFSGVVVLFNLSTKCYHPANINNSLLDPLNVRFVSCFRYGFCAKHQLVFVWGKITLSCDRLDFR